VDGLSATKSEGVGLSNLCDPDPPTLQTDGQTDGRHAISIPRYTLVHRAVKIENLAQHCNIVTWENAVGKERHVKSFPKEENTTLQVSC